MENKDSIFPHENAEHEASWLQKNSNVIYAAKSMMLYIFI